MTYKTVAYQCILVLLLLLVSTFSVMGEEAMQVEITLPKEAFILKGQILLGEIGEVTGTAELAEKVAAVNAGTAPVAGSSRRLTKGQIEVRLRQAGIDPSLVVFKGSDIVQVYRLSTNKEEQAEKPNQVSAGSNTYKVVVVTGDIPRGEILTTSDLAYAERELRPSQVDGRSIDAFVGLRSTRFLSEGTVLTDLNVEIPPTIERGDQLTILVQTQGIIVTAPGVARGSGGVGEMIAVENSLSRQVIQAVIIDSKTVQVQMRGSVSP